MVKLLFLIASATPFFVHGTPLDSLRLETINGKSFVIHQVDEQETLYGISRRYGTPIPQILEYNKEADAGLDVGQILRIPYTPKPKVQENGQGLHVVAAGETLFSISRAYGLSVEELKEINGLGENAISIGQQLKVKKTGPTINTPVQSNSAVGYHTVAAKETLFSISRDYGISVQELKEWNNLTGSNLDIGQLLKVSKPGDLTTTVVAQPIAKPDTATKSAMPENVIKISEKVTGTDEIRESGLAELIDGTEGNRKYLALHRTAKTGTILKVRNELNNREVFVRVVGSLPNTGVNNNIIIKISKSAFDRLGGVDAKFRVELTYYK
ncbi:MAG: LysM peptidoglycan-binding domain-containing protein [Cyclobacteriaceae bacterium]